MEEKRGGGGYREIKYGLILELKQILNWGLILVYGGLIMKYYVLCLNGILNLKCGVMKVYRLMQNFFYRV